MEYTISPFVQFRLALKHVIKKYWHRKQKALAMEAGISEAMLSDVKKGKKTISLKKQIAIAEAAGYRYENFLSLGRMIHNKDDENNLPKPSCSYKQTTTENEPVSVLNIKQNDSAYDKNGGYKQHTWEEIGGNPKMSKAVSMLIKIYDSNDARMIKLINRILYDFSRDLTMNDNGKRKP